MENKLTKQWHNGKLSEGYYYTQKNGVESIHSNKELNDCDFLDGIVILGKVPTYKEFLNKQNERS